MRAHTRPSTPSYPRSDLEAEEGAVLRDLPEFNASARHVHAQQQLTRAAVAVRQARALLAEYDQVRGPTCSAACVVRGPTRIRSTT